MSPRAAWRLESLGFTRVYDYAGGKTDWTGSGFPIEGSHAAMPTPGSLVRDKVATCSLEERAGDVAARLEGADDRVCIVTTADGVVLGRLRGKQLSGDPGRTAEEAMEPGPTTVRADEELTGLVHRMQLAGVASIVVTEPSGKLIGIMYRSDAQQLLEGVQQFIHEHDHDH